EQEKIRPAERGHRGEDPVLYRDPVAWRGLAERIREVTREEREPEMQRAHLGVVQDEGVERERQRRRVPELQQRPADAHRRQEEASDLDGLATAEVGLLV